jgi:hypothetical protein
MDDISKLEIREVEEKLKHKLSEYLTGHENISEFLDKSPNMTF